MSPTVLLRTAATVRFIRRKAAGQPEELSLHRITDSDPNT
jgi:hypothetical protein